jgi:hypothetical protein
MIQNPLQIASNPATTLHRFKKPLTKLLDPLSDLFNR